jgi:hypothetical protein
MNTKEFENYNCGIAYHIEKFKHGQSTGDELYEAMKAHIGRDAFKSAQEIMDEKED